jgi:hypothetical protein
MERMTSVEPFWASQIGAELTTPHYKESKPREKEIFSARLKPALIQIATSRGL